MSPLDTKSHQKVPHKNDYNYTSTSTLRAVLQKDSTHVLFHNSKDENIQKHIAVLQYSATSPAPAPPHTEKQFLYQTTQAFGLLGGYSPLTIQIVSGTTWATHSTPAGGSWGTTRTAPRTYAPAAEGWRSCGLR